MLKKCVCKIEKEIMKCTVWMKTSWASIAVVVEVVKS